MSFDVICIRWGTKYSHDYVVKLRDQLKGYNLICLTDQPERVEGIEYRECFEGLEGWYQKLGLFQKGYIEKRTLFLDLDVIVTGDISHFFNWPYNFGIAQDFIWNGFNSSVMIIEPDCKPEIYERYKRNPFIHKKGDQGIIEDVFPDAKTFPRDWCVSYKVDKITKKPHNKIVVFHGKPNPPDCKDEWIGEYW